MKGGFVYILTNKHHNVLYVGVTSSIVNRIHQHKNHFYKNSFTTKYNVEKLVYYEMHQTIEDAISREKEIKKWNRSKKETLINTLNPDWKELWDEINGDT